MTGTGVGTSNWKHRPTLLSTPLYNPLIAAQAAFGVWVVL